MPEKTSPKRKKALRLNANHLFLISLPAAAIFAAFIFWTSAQRTNQTQASAACRAEDFSGLFQEGEEVAYFGGRQVSALAEVPSYLGQREKTDVLGLYSGDERFIEVDLSEQKLIAWEGNQVFLETPVSTGLPWWPTPTGEFRIWIKLRATKMEGGTGRNYYYLPNVPYVMFFENEQVPGRLGYGLHGTYWHDDFGTPRSHGCVNLPTPIAEKLYYWTLPTIPEGKYVVQASRENRGTRIIIHE